MNQSTSHTQRREPARLAHYAAPYPPLALEGRHSVDTECAAFHLNRSSQTMRIWACKQTGPLQPKRVNGRLAWAVADIRRLLGVPA